MGLIRSMARARQGAYLEAINLGPQQDAVTGRDLRFPRPGISLRPQWLDPRSIRLVGPRIMGVEQFGVEHISVVRYESKRLLTWGKVREKADG